MLLVRVCLVRDGKAEQDCSSSEILRFDYPAGTLANACPHSTQEDLWRGVINPQ